MNWDATLTNLGDYLADNYPTNEDARRISTQAGLKPRLISFSQKAVNTWFSVLNHAKNRNKIQDVIEVVKKEIGDNEWLQLAEQNGLTAVKGPDIDQGLPWGVEYSKDKLERIMGKRSTLLPIHFLDKGRELANAVARIRFPDNQSGTGFLIEGNLLITNHHVIPNKDIAKKVIVQFNYQLNTKGLFEPIDEFTLSPHKEFRTSPEEENDWTVVTVAGNPEQKYGALKLVPVTLQKLEYVNIIQHPGGGPKQIALYHNYVTYEGSNRVRYLTDTLPGSSGSPVFNSEWQVVAVHHSGGWHREPITQRHVYRNEGININVIIDGLISAGLYTSS